MNECLPPGAPIVPIADDVVEHIQRMSDDIAGEGCRRGAWPFKTRGAL